MISTLTVIRLHRAYFDANESISHAAAQDRLPGSLQHYEASLRTGSQNVASYR